jgi:hypothetical protein
MFWGLRLESHLANIILIALLRIIHHLISSWQLSSRRVDEQAACTGMSPVLSAMKNAAEDTHPQQRF